MFKSFNAKLRGVYTQTEDQQTRGIDTTIRFTKNMIHLENEQFQRLVGYPIWENPIPDKAYYTFTKSYNQIDEKVYKVKIEGSETVFVLDIDWKNKIAAKWIHEMFWIQKEPLAVIAVIIASLSLLATIVLGVLQLK